MTIYLIVLNSFFLLSYVSIRVVDQSDCALHELQHSGQLQERILKDEADNKVQKGTVVKFLLSHKFDKSVLRRMVELLWLGKF